jgi:tRNA(Ile)-lysidine synthase
MDITDRFLVRVHAAIDAHAMLRTGDRVLVAVSGGADSVALLHALHLLGWPVAVAHLDHQTRDGDSRADAQWVAAETQRLNLPFFSISRPVAQEARAAGLSFELHARNVRYAFFKQAAREQGCTIIATGHHADDQAETVLMRVLRGTTPNGLAGIPPVRDDEELRIIRPLHTCTREMITIWLEDLGVTWREDKSNADPQYSRNRVRRELLPRLEQDYNPRVRDALLRLAEVQRCENDLINRLLDDALQHGLERDDGVGRAAFAAIHEALQRRLVQRLAQAYTIEIPFDRTCDAVDFIRSAPTGQYFDLGGGVSLYNARDHTEVITGEDEAHCTLIPLDVPGETFVMGRRFVVRCYDAPREKDWRLYCTPQRQVFDADKVLGELAVRTWRQGDRFIPFGMTGAKKLHDYFVDIGLPAPRRKSTPLLVSGDRILWITGHAISAEAPITPETRQVLEIEVMPCD